ncbi:rod shape-determining protein MreD [Chitinispirillales bacterium ANBcel5]|uniref:rod shape-determining protein MreD n=1 Tax=Cellulosispirillum alkaliphilum TaxID=3039283 RepID=UPI002A53DC5F|nr:rod shape-determining protein MreD [Chitinispirillales bacterium ANBcel5]
MIKKVIYWISFFGICFILQTTLVRAISIYGVRPDLMIVALFLFSNKFGVMAGVYVGFLLGLTQDLYSPILGQNALSKSVVGYIGGLLNEKVIRLDPVLKGILLIFLFTVNDFLELTVQIVKNEGSMEFVFSQLLVSTLPRAFYSLLFAVIPFLWVSIIQPAIKR